MECGFSKHLGYSGEYGSFSKTLGRSGEYSRVWF